MSKRLGERMKCNICNELMKEETDYYICPYCSYALKRKIESKETQYKRYLAHKYDENYISYMKNLTREIDFNNKLVLDFVCGQQPCLSKIYLNSKFVNYDLFFYPNEDYKLNKYDLILIIEVIEHLENPYDVLNELTNLLKEDGKIMIHTMLYDEKTDFRNWWYTRDITHISFFKKETFAKACKRLNLKMELINGFIVLSNN